MPVLKRVRQFLPAMASADSALRSKVAAVEGGKDTLDIEVLTDNEKYVEMVRRAGGGGRVSCPLGLLGIMSSRWDLTLCVLA